MVASFLAQRADPREDTTSAQFRGLRLDTRGAIAAFSLLAAARVPLAHRPAALPVSGRAGPQSAGAGGDGRLRLHRPGPDGRPEHRQLGGGDRRSPPTSSSRSLWSRTSHDALPIPRQIEATELDREGHPLHGLATTLEVELSGRQLSNRASTSPTEEQALIDRLDAAGVDHEEDSDGRSGDALAERISDDSTAGQVGGSLLSSPPCSGLIVAMVYVPLQAVRAGLLTRFFGTLGMALGVSIILLPPGTAAAGPLVRVAGPALRRQGARRAPARLGGRRGDPLAEARGGAEREAPPSGEAIEGEATEVPADGEQPQRQRAASPAPASASASAAAEPVAASSSS